MNTTLLTILIISLSIFAFYYAVYKIKSAQSINTKHRPLHSYYGWYCLFWTIFPALLFFCFWTFGSNVWIDKTIINIITLSINEEGATNISLQLNAIKNAANGILTDQVPKEILSNYISLNQKSEFIRFIATLGIAIIGLFFVIRKINPDLRARNKIERILMVLMFIASFIAIIVTLGIVLSLLFETLKFFSDVSPFEFFLGTTWSPQIALREDQVAASGSFGAIPVFTGTLLITIIAMCVAIPIGLLAAIYLAEYANQRTRTIVKPLLEILAGIPTVVYGFFAALTVGPFIRNIGETFGLSIASESALAAGLVMGIMIIPFISSLSDDVISAVPNSLREGSYGLGATKYETIILVIFPAALPGIIGSILLATSRAIGETMIVVMAAGLAAKLTANPLDSVTTVTVQIVTLLIGDHEFDSSKTMAAFALGLTLFIITLILNVIALKVVLKYREKYE